jgi:hypothetical protein
MIPKKIRHIYYLCPDDDTHIGGILKIYNHVEILSDKGYSAFVLHNKPGFRCSWFKNYAPIAYPLLKPCDNLHQILRNISPVLFRQKYYLQSWQKGLQLISHNHAKLPPISEEDVLVIPEMMTPFFDITQGNLPFVIFTQGAYLTFNSLKMPRHRFKAQPNPDFKFYQAKNLLGVMTVSKDNTNYLKLVYPHLPTYRIRIAIPKSIFSYNGNKKRLISYMPRKLESDVRQVIYILQARDRLKNWEFYPIDKLPREETAKILNESALFLSFCYQEGFSLPPAEAMASGCIVIGYSGQGGKEYFFHTPHRTIEPGNIIEFVQEVEKIALDYENNLDYYLNTTKAASDKILNDYSQENEKQDVLHTWEQIQNSLNLKEL